MAKFNIVDRSLDSRIFAEIFNSHNARGHPPHELELLRDMEDGSMSAGGAARILDALDMTTLWVRSHFMEALAATGGVYQQASQRNIRRNARRVGS